jgi:hypothetical protein
MDFSLYFNGIHINMKGISEAQYVFLEWNHIYNISLYHNYTKYFCEPLVKERPDQVSDTDFCEPLVKERADQVRMRGSY